MCLSALLCLMLVETSVNEDSRVYKAPAPVLDHLATRHPPLHTRSYVRLSVGCGSLGFLTGSAAWLIILLQMPHFVVLTVSDLPTSSVYCSVVVSDFSCWHDSTSSISFLKAPSSCSRKASHFLRACVICAHKSRWCSSGCLRHFSEKYGSTICSLLTGDLRFIYHFVTYGAVCNTCTFESSPNGLSPLLG